MNKIALLVLNNKDTEDIILHGFAQILRSDFFCQCNIAENFAQGYEISPGGIRLLKSEYSSKNLIYVINFSFYFFTEAI